MATNLEKWLRITGELGTTEQTRKLLVEDKLGSIQGLSEVLV